VSCGFLVMTCSFDDIKKYSSKENGAELYHGLYSHSTAYVDVLK